MSHPSSNSGAHGDAAEDAEIGRDPKGEAGARPSPETRAGTRPDDARSGQSPLEPGLYVVATPIGNLRDITLRALDVLAGVDRIYAEDTRVTRKLLDAHGISSRLSAYHDHSDEAARDEILGALAAGGRIALVSDAGTPMISDPGFKLARAAAEGGFKIIPIPGASALLAALVGAGLPTDRFLFAGFAPSKAQARADFFAELAGIDCTIVVYETGPRLAESLAAMADAFGARPAAVARELTKMFEEYRRAPLPELAAHYARAATPKGEIVVVIGPPEAPGEIDDAALDAFLASALDALGVKGAAQLAHEELGVARKRAYGRALALKGET